ncbi:MAG: hypothetical protein MJZ91_03485 [Bacteroidales bacterium]|nr:hypothetical protein [Bacteroidales bacterium]
MKSIKRVIRYETMTKQERLASLAAYGCLSCCKFFASPCMSSRIDFRPQGLASRLMHDAKLPSQHAAGWLASSRSLVSNKQFYMNLEKSTTLSSLKIEFHAQAATLSSLKIEFHAQTATLCSLKIEFHVQTATLCSLKIEFHAQTATLCSLKIEMSLSGSMIAFFAVVDLSTGSCALSNINRFF